MTSKHKIHLHFQQLVQDKIDVFRDRIAALTEDSKNDAKGSAGDKHETALSMMHLEQEKANYKLQEFLGQQQFLNKIDTTINSKKVIVGSLVQVNQMMVYVSVALPKTSIDNVNIFAISPQSPLGEKIFGQAVGFEFDLNNNLFKIALIE